ncbi:hypothetical protein LLF85_07710, partial [bacterium]|nr:hypothetical protein [bacterium]
PAMPNPTSISTINSMSTSSLPEQQLLSHSITSATTAGSSSGGEPGSFAPPPGPSDGIANAGKREVPDVTATLSLVGADNMPMYSDALIGAIPVPVIGGGGDKIQPTPPKFDPPPTTGGGYVRGGNIDDVGGFAGDEWKGLQRLLDKWLTGLFGVGIAEGGLGVLEAYTKALKEAGDEDKFHETFDWLIWGEFEGKFYIFGYQFAGAGPRFFWGPRVQHPEVGIYAGKLFTCEEYEVDLKNGGKGKQKIDGFCFLTSWAPCFNKDYTRGAPHSGLHGVNNTGSDIEILMQLGANFDTGTRRKIMFDNVDISISKDGTVLAGLTKCWNYNLDSPKNINDAEGIVTIAYINGDYICGSTYKLNGGEIAGSNFDSNDYCRNSPYMRWVSDQLYFFGKKTGVVKPGVEFGNVANPGWGI